MGMQCTFEPSQLEELFVTKTVHDIESDTYTLEVYSKKEEWEEEELLYSFNLHNGESVSDTFCWFDCGSRTKNQMFMIEFLIRNRVCFTCA